MHLLFSHALCPIKGKTKAAPTAKCGTIFPVSLLLDPNDKQAYTGSRIPRDALPANVMLEVHRTGVNILERKSKVGAPGPVLILICASPPSPFLCPPRSL